MNYIVIDFEFNQCYNFKDGKITVNEPRCPFEIIQIGTVKLNESFEIIGKANFMIKPQIYNRMHPIVENMTGLKMQNLIFEKTFPEVYEEFSEFLGKEKYVFCVWGSGDLKALFKNVNYYKLNHKLVSKKYLNVQTLAAKYLKRPSGMAIGLKNAITELSLTSELPFHNALHDAIYTAEIFKIVQRPNMEIHMFNMANIIGATPCKSDTICKNNLYDFIELQLNREISPIEKEVFKKVYNAGKTKLFDVKQKPENS